MTIGEANAKTAPMTNGTTPITADEAVLTMSFEHALEELGAIVRQLEAGEAPLDQTISLYERAMTLKATCDARLRDAEARIERIRTGADGAAVGGRCPGTRLSLLAQWLAPLRVAR